MRKVERIANRQFTYILFLMRTTIALAFLPMITTGEARQDVWLASMFLFVFVVLLGSIIAGLANRYPQENIVEYGERLLGPVLGRMVVLPILWLFLHLSAIDIRAYAEIVVSGFLPETPMVFIILAMVFVATLAALSGLEVIGRCGDVIFFIFVLSTVAAILGAAQEMDFMNLEPVLSRGVRPILSSTVVPLSFGAHLLIMLFVWPHLEEKKKGFQSMLLAIAAASLFLLILSTAVVLVLGPDQSSRAVFPFLRMLRAVEVSEFLERMELLIIFAWGFSLFIGISVFLFVGAQGLASILKLSDPRPLMPPMAVIWVVLGLHVFEDIFTVHRFFQARIMGPYMALFSLVPVLVVWVVSLVRGKEEK